MEIILNGKNEKFEYNSLTITELLKEKNFTFPGIVINLNEQFIKKDKYNTTTIVNGDKIDIIHMISGG